MLGVILLILAGLAIMAYGIFIFYAWLPLLYGLFGLEIGLLLGRSLTGDTGVLAIILGAVGAVIMIFTAWSRSVPVGLSPAGSTARVKPFSRPQSVVTAASGHRLG